MLLRVQAAEEDEYRSLSFWHASAPGPIRARAPLSSDDQLDVAIVGAGYTGLWTAYYLKKLEPGIRVAIVDQLAHLFEKLLAIALDRRATRNPALEVEPADEHGQLRGQV